MKHVVLYREPSEDQGTFGYWTYEGSFWHSLELPWRYNTANLSSIPTGTYKCVIRYSPRFKTNTYHITNVKGRSYILLHSANFAGDIQKGWQSHLNGCIAIGKARGSFPNKFGNRQKAVLNSRLAGKEFMDLMGEEFNLTIEELGNG